MDTNKMREEFEAAFAKETASKAPAEKTQVLEAYGGFERLLLETLVEDRLGDTYQQNVFAASWWAWQASRAAVVVELPSLSEGNRPYNQGVYDTKCRIEAQGLKVKP